MAMLSIGASLLPIYGKANVFQRRTIKILVRSGWQAVNIGDIGHTFGLIQLIKNHLPGVTITLWPRYIDYGVQELLLSKFKDLQIVRGNVLADGKPDSQGLLAAFRNNDFLIHGSRAQVGVNDLNSWKKITGKPFGVFGVTIDYVNEEILDVVKQAAFFYCRETSTLNYLNAYNVRRCSFVPDSTFAMEVRNEQLGLRFLEAKGLEKGRFICVIPRLRYTPYWLMGNKSPNDEDLKKYQISQYYKEPDHEKLREVIVSWVRETGLKVLVCAEVTYQVALGKELLVDLMPEDVKAHVVWLDRYWIVDEAQSVYAMSRALVSFEPHSPIMAFSSGIPGIYLRQPTDTRKGQMWKDIGLSDWLFEIDTSSGKEIFNTVMDIHTDYGEAQAKLERANRFVMKKQKEGISKVLNSFKRST